jgi:hypothetical protein
MDAGRGIAHAEGDALHRSQRGRDRGDLVDRPLYREMTGWWAANILR